MLKQILDKIDSKVKDRIKTIAIFSDDHRLEKDADFIDENCLPYRLQPVSFNPSTIQYYNVLRDHDKGNRVVINEPIYFTNVPLETVYGICRKYFELTIHNDKIIVGDSII